MIAYINNIFLKYKEFLSFFIIKSVGLFLTMLIPLLLAKIFAPEMFGYFSLYLMILFLTNTIFISPILTPFNVNANKEFSNNQKINETFTSVLIYLILSLLLFILFFQVFGEYLLNFIGLGYEDHRIIFLLSFIGLFLYRFFSSIFLSLDKKIISSIIELLFPLIQVSYLGILYYNDILTLENVFLSYFYAGFFILFVFIFFINYEKLLPFSYNKKNFNNLIHFGFWVILGHISSYLINWGDNLVLNFYVSISEIGVYNLAYQFFKGLVMLSFVISTYYTPFVSKNIENKKKIKEYLNEKNKIFIYISIIIIILGITIGPLINFFFDESYHPSITIIRILLIANLISFYFTFLIPIYNALKEYKAVQVFLLIQVLMNLFLNMLFVKAYGIYGAAIATSLAYLIFLIIYLAYFNKKIKKYYY